MTRSIDRRILLAGATATALLTLGVLAGSTSASAAPATASASAMDSGSQAPADVVSHPYALYIDNTFAEYIARVDGLSDNQVTLVRGATRSQALDDLINSPAGVRKNISLQVLDQDNNPVKTYNIANAQPIRYDGTDITFQFSRIIIS